MNIDFDFLAKETLALRNQADKLSSFDDYFEDLQENNFISCHDSNEESFPNKPGLLFYVERGASTFCLRGIATDDIEYSAEEFLKGDKKIEKKFRASCDEVSDQLLSFITEDAHEAEVLVDLIFNRRYPNQEDVLCNISDPGFSWWLNDNGNSFNIYFQSHGIERAQNFTRLGPLGDSILSSRRLKDALPHLRESFSINEFSSDRKSFSISSAAREESDTSFNDFKDLFLSGSKPLSRDFFPDSTHGLTLYLFFKELALTRRFWLLVESQTRRCEQ